MSSSGLSLDNLLTSIIDSLKLTSSSLDNLDGFITESKNYPELVNTLLKASSTPSSSLEGVSLLGLKNSSLLSYLNSLALIIGSKLNSLDSNQSLLEGQTRSRAITNSVVQRVTLDRGVKPLEKKLNYQLEKLVSAYNRREKEQNDVEAKANESSSDDDDDESEEEEEALTYRPDPSALLKKSRYPATISKKKKLDKKPEDADDQEQEDEEDKPKADKYRPPKISAVLPPSHFNDSERKSDKKQRNLQSMDEYLQDISEATTAEASIGATIIDQGRNIKSAKQIAKEEEVRKYEEENFIRLPSTQTKESRNDKMKRARNEFFGEDWSMFTNNRDHDEATSNGGKKKRRVSAWERAKKKARD